jgi:hypothetical protein
MSNKTEIVVRWASYRKVFSAISGEGVFQHPQALTLIDPSRAPETLNECNRDFSPIIAVSRSAAMIDKLEHQRIQFAFNQPAAGSSQFR